MERYDSYKDSCVDWIGEIPSHWGIKNLKLSFKIKKGKLPKSLTDLQKDDFLPYLSMDVLRGDSPKEFSKVGDGVFIKENEIGIIWDGSNSGEIIRINQDGILSSTISKLSSIDKSIYNNYSYYLLKFYESDFRLNTIGMGIPHMDGNHLRFSKILFPSLEEQKKIVDLLDTKTHLIDSLVEKTQMKIELLKEQRTSLINQVVTKGLNPDVEMKDSSVEWIGEIPSHWFKTKVKYISNVVRGSILRPVDEPKYFDENGKWTYLNISDVSKVSKYLDSGKLRLSELGSTKSRRVEPNNLIITGSGTVGKVFVNRIPICVHDGFIPLLKLKVNINFMFYYLINPNLYVGIGKTNSQKNIYLDEVKEMDISIPSQQEQQQIVEYLDEQTELIDLTISKEEKRIKLLKEYRQSLISEVVTGKIKVTNE